MNEDVSDASEDEEVDASDIQPQRIFLDGDDIVTALTQFDKYVNQGPHLEYQPLYDYVACIKMVRAKTKDDISVAIGM